MSKLHQPSFRFIWKLSISIVLLMFVVLPARPVDARWPPFIFELIPSVANDRITFTIDLQLRPRDQDISNIQVNIPIPEGTRFLEASAEVNTSTGYDGTEVTFFTTTPRKGVIQNAKFTVELIDPSVEIYRAHAWIAWEGEAPGDYLTEAFLVNTSQEALAWEEPVDSRLELKTVVKSKGSEITYLVYPRNIGNRMWDVQITVPIPEGTQFLSAQAPHPFVVGNNYEDVSFSAIELPGRLVLPPLKVQVTTADAEDPFLVTQVWAGWKNVGQRAGSTVPVTELMKTNDIVIQPRTTQFVVLDDPDDVPFGSYDVTSVVFEETSLSSTREAAVKILLHTAEALGPNTEPFVYSVYVDNDCQRASGYSIHQRGAEYRIRYRHLQQQADFSVWDAEEKEWLKESISYTAPIYGKMVAMWVPASLLDDDQRFCWVAESRYLTNEFSPRPLTDFVPDSNDSRLYVYEASSDGPVIQHMVQQGDTLYELALAYDVPFQSIIEANNISESTVLNIGDILVIPSP